MTLTGRRARLGALLAVVGPRAAGRPVDDDPPASTCSVLGADHGYQLLWVLLLSTVALVIFHAWPPGWASSRTGLIGLVRQRYGVQIGGAVLALPSWWPIFGTTCMIAASSNCSASAATSACPPR